MGATSTAAAATAMASSTTSPRQNGSGGAATPSTTPSVPFSVSAATIDSGPGNYNGTCTPTMAFTFTGTITVPAGTAGGTVKYEWVHNQSVETETRTVSFAPGQTTQSVSDTMTLPAYDGGGQSYNNRLVILAPSDVGSAFSTFTFMCVVKVTSVNVSFTPTAFDCSTPLSQHVFTFKAVLSVTPGPAATGSYQADFGLYGGTSNDRTIATFQIPSGATSVTLTIRHTLTSRSLNGTYYEIFKVEQPTETNPYTATFTKQC
ncbi:MAG TPA: hypothetical protein VFU88_11960 [Ktedonobacterales bacterium]|nr:hypothetical protein [Ktedonobacterales bacterium]